MGQWYDYDMKSKKALIVLMERSKDPMIVTAGKILELSLVTFATVFIFWVFFFLVVFICFRF